MCDRVAVAGNSGIFICPECVDVITLPSGMVICIGISDRVIFVRLLDGVDKCIVHPVSMIVGVIFCVGGPRSCEVLTVVAIFVKLVLLPSGSPPRQSLVAGFGLLFLPMFILQHPSIISVHVASFW